MANASHHAEKARSLPSASPPERPATAQVPHEAPDSGHYRRSGLKVRDLSNPEQSLLLRLLHTSGPATDISLAARSVYPAAAECLSRIPKKQPGQPRQVDNPLVKVAQIVLLLFDCLLFKPSSTVVFLPSWSAYSDQTLFNR